jgi:gamma-glutamyl-gamma-aminobutyrate hydrolase PuuD
VIVIIGSEWYGDPLRHIDKVVSDINSLMKHPEEVSLVMFTGGEDVHPSLYGGVEIPNLCMNNIRRDEFEKKVFAFCRKYNIKMTGICRGIQFLNVMAGGAMYQHIREHAGVLYHNAYFPYDNSIKRVTSTHHQLVNLPSGSIPIAWSQPSRSDIYIGAYGDEEEPPEHEIEAAIFPNINAMGVQYHPEMLRKDDPCRIHYGEMISDFVSMEMKEYINKYGRRAIDGRTRKAGHPRREG